MELHLQTIERGGAFCMGYVALRDRRTSFFLRFPPLRVISTLHLQVIPSNRGFEPSIHNELWPVNAEPAANSLLMRSRDREVCRLLMQQEYVTMSWRRASGWRRTKVRRRCCGCRSEDRCAVLLGAGGRVILQKGMQDG